MNDVGCKSRHMQKKNIQPDCGPHSLPFGGYWNFFPREKAIGHEGWSLNLLLVPRVKVDVSIHPVLYVPSWLILG
jgi:hypothetical protein